MRKISFDVNNGEKLNILQEKHDGNVRVNINDNHSYYISAGDFVMLLNYYRHVKDNDIQNDFINFNGQN